MRGGQQVAVTMNGESCFSISDVKEGEMNRESTATKTVSGSRLAWEIEEEYEDNDDDKASSNRRGRLGETRLTSIKEEPTPLVITGSNSLFGYNDNDGEDSMVYVAVGKSNESSSMEALVWALNNYYYNFSSSVAATTTSATLFLVHVFPELHSIPTPLGKIPVSQVNPEQKQSYMNHERIKRIQFLQKFLDVCSAAKVKVDTILIESDAEAKALLDLIPILNIRNLVLGVAKSNFRKLRSRRRLGNETVEVILEKAPEFCKVNIICEGGLLLTTTAAAVADQSPSILASPNANIAASASDSPNSKHPQWVVPQANTSFCTCFNPPKVIK